MVSRSETRLRNIALACAAMTAIVSGVALAGWMTKWLIIASISPDYIPMAPSTALCFIMLSGALLFHLSSPQRRIGRISAHAGIFVVFLICLYILIAFFAGRTPEIEYSLFGQRGNLGGIPIGLMSPITAISLMLACSAEFLLLSAATGRQRSRHAAAYFAAALVLIGFVMVLGYLYGTPVLYGGTIIPVALPTSIALLFMGVGLLAVSGGDAFPVRLFIGPSVRSRLMRAFFPVAIFSIVFAGWLDAAIMLPFMKNHALTSSLVTILSAGIFGIIITKMSDAIGSSIDRSASERKLAEDAFRESEQRYHSLFENMLEGFAYCRMVYENELPRDFIYLDVNNAFERLTGLKEVVGKKATEVIPGIREDHPELFETYGRVALTGKPEQFEVHSELFGGWLSITVYSVEKGFFVAIFDNVTERKQRERELEAISALSKALRSASDRADQFRIVLDHVSDLLRVDGASIAVRDPTTGETIVALGRGGWEKWTGLRLPPGEGVMGQVISTARSYLNDDASSDPHLLRPDMLEGLNAVACVPLVAEKQTLGALMAGCRTSLRVEEIQLLQAIGEIAAIAIHRLSLLKQAVMQAQHLSALHEIDVAISSSLDLRVSLKVLLGHVTKELGADAAAVFLLNQHTQTLTYAAGHGFRTREIEQARIKLGEGCAGRAALERKTVSMPDAVKDDAMCSHVRMLKGEAFVSHHVAPLIVKGRVKGVLEIFNRSPLATDPAWMDFFEALAGQAAIAVDSATLFNDLQRANDELVLAYDATIEGWSRALDLRDKETEGHSQRVTELTVDIARAMGMSEDDLVHVRRGALLHDIGKMGIPDSILLKPGKLSDEEWVIMRKHPVFARDLISPIDFLKTALDIPYCHHEKWDGTGYPAGLKGGQIPLAARIFSVVDVWDALGSDRPYRPAWPKEKMLQYLRDQSGKDFDPKIVGLFLKQVESR